MARYFLHLPPDGSAAVFWRAINNFAGQPFHYNLNLLAHAVGDDPAALLPPGGMLVPAQDYLFGPGTVSIQPFAFTMPDGDVNRPNGLRIGRGLRRFLDDPLDGEAMELSLPFYRDDVKLGPAGGGWFRKENNETGFHCGTDFNLRPRAVFEVCAAADGIVLARAGANGEHGNPIVLSHFTPSGKEYRTIYQHLDIPTVSADITVGTSVRRGQFLGRISDVQVIHLHFGVAVQGPAVSLNGVDVPQLWYAIDPWGVYDYYEHTNNLNSNYLPPENHAQIFQSMIVGAVHTIQWRTQPLFKTIPTAHLTNGYKKIVRIQVRDRRSDDHGGALPDEQEQFLVWLRDDPDFFLVPLAQAKDRTTELGLIALLRSAFFNQKPVRLEFRFVGDLRFIMAAWVDA